jgi:hypothetical protein
MFRYFVSLLIFSYIGVTFADSIGGYWTDLSGMPTPPGCVGPYSTIESAGYECVDAVNSYYGHSNYSYVSSDPYSQTIVLAYKSNQFNSYAAYHCADGTVTPYADRLLNCTCPNGDIPVNGQCLSCGPGQHEWNGICVDDSGCPPGMSYDENWAQCIYDDCSQAGQLEASNPGTYSSANSCIAGCWFAADMVYVFDGTGSLLTPTGDSCTVVDADSADYRDTDDPCIADPEICRVDEYPDVCAQVGDKVICPGDQPHMGCKVFDDGTLSCDADAPAPPAPDTITPGVPDPPDYIVAAVPNGDATYNTTIIITDNPSNLPGDVIDQSNIYGDMGNGGGGDMAGFCEDNPRSIICRNGSISVSCRPDGGVNFRCDWNPIQCEIAKQTAMQYCQDEFHAKSWQKYIDDNGANQPTMDDLLNNFYQEKDLSADMSNIQFNQDAFLSDSCPADKTFSFNGGTFTISFKPFCDLADMLYMLLIAIAYFIAGRVALKTAFS